MAFNNLDYSLYLSSTVVKLVFDPTRVNGRYLFHFLMSKDYEIHQNVYGADPKRLDLDGLGKMPISLPPIEKQIKLASMLDSFYELSEELYEELYEELILRKKQYEHYRDELLSFKQDNKIKWLSLEEITNNTFRGSFFTKKLVTEVGEPCIRYAQLYEENRLHFDDCALFTNKSKIQNPKYCQYGNILITRVSNIPKNIAKACAYLGNVPAIIDDGIIGICHSQNPKYLAYSLSTTDAQKQKIKLGKTSGLCTITFEQIKEIKIPVPPLQKQEEIVNLLDKFWSLSNNIKKGLPAEVLMRKQQYEYYRNKLLK